MSVDKDNLEEPLHVYYRALGAKRVSEYPILIQNVLVTTQCHKYRLCRPSCPPCVHSPAASGWRTFSFSQGDNDRFWRTEWTPQTVQLIRCSHPCSHSPSIPPARPFQIYENGPLWQPPPCDKRVEESGHHVRTCSEKNNSVEISLNMLRMQSFPSFSDIWLTSC